MSSIASLVAHDRELRKQDQSYVLATIVDTAGSTYRKAGARMIITRDGDYFGLISGGCLEGDLLLHAARVFDNGQPEIVEYDMRAEDDLVWGLGLGCNGMIRILLELIRPGETHAVLAGLARAFETCSPIRIACSLPGLQGEGEVAGVSCACLVGEPGEIIYSEGAAAPVREACRELLSDSVDSPRIVKTTIDDSDFDIYLESIDPPVHLLILGGGPDVQPLTQNAALLGWQLTVLDHRAAYADPAKFPRAAKVVKVEAAGAIGTVEADTVSAVILMSHHFPTDCVYLRQVLQTGIPFIGLLGPRVRGMKLFEEIGKDWEAEQYRVHSPVGLDIGGETPESIALSIVVEIQSFIEGRPGHPLRDRNTGIHD